LDDPYKTLGVKRDASQDAIRSAFRGLAKQHHPDLNPGDAAAEERFKEISAANELLCDPAKRLRFDNGEIDASGQEQAPRTSYRDHADGEAGRKYSRAGASAGWGEDDLNDIFGSMFSGERGRHGASVMRGQDERYTLTTAFLDAVAGATRRLTLPDGRTLDVKIPAGTTDGQTLRLRNQGAVGWNGGEAGDALIEIRVAEHAFFKRKGRDILLELPVTLAEAVLGGSVDVPTPTGAVRMRIPAGSDTGTRLRLRGKGIPGQAGADAGDLYATLRVEIGKSDAALEDFLRGWTPEHPFDPRRAMEAGQ
jgi:DnaJ-class molecular chaperone